MSKNVLFTVNTIMESKDYKKFSYLTIFKNKRKTFSFMVLLAAVGAFFAVMSLEKYDLPWFLGIWAILIATAFVAIILRVEYKNLNRMNQVRAGLTDPRQKITFYDRYLIAESNSARGSNKFNYDRLYQTWETRDYYIIYANANSASLIRKIDINEEYRTEFHEFIREKLGDRYKKM
ncbi:MAG: rane associated protein [Bacillota bacterium]|nr:rane associated protein [Bacillota bacterium]